MRDIFSTYIIAEIEGKLKTTNLSLVEFNIDNYYNKRSKHR